MNADPRFSTSGAFLYSLYAVFCVLQSDSMKYIFRKTRLVALKTFSLMYTFDF